ncbi:D-threo-3-hydroxyaspartate dehydratase [bioreactor metagenome]|uniref:D-threo-3-hydroxyaspartate dehydratase n=1 Tax=bioreactor metagenome TaxID=1076179 RepID=A0A644Z9W8_9ZZZZ
MRSQVGALPPLLFIVGQTENSRIYEDTMSVLDSIDQPVLLLNEGVARANLERMAAKIAAAGVRFRPHFKTHQSAQIGEWFKDYGVQAITVSSVEMAEYFADAGWQDILIAFSVNIRQSARIEALAKRIQLSVLVENEAEVAVLAGLDAVHLNVWVKVDVGNHRTGLDWMELGAIMHLCRSIRRSPQLALRGLLTHSGNTYHSDGVADIQRTFRDGVERLNSLRSALLEQGVTGLEISVGDTPGCSLCDDFSGIDELRPGNFIFYDAQQVAIGSCSMEQIAVAVACPVVALHPERGEVVVYGGAIHLSKDFLEVDGKISFGLVALAQGIGWGEPLDHCIIRSLSQEHGILQFTDGKMPPIHVGDLVMILPAHSCLTVQVMRRYLTLDGKVFETMNH